MTPIQDKFNLLLQNGFNLGAPVGPEITLFDGGSRQQYEFGNIYFHLRVGAFECHGLILQQYIEFGEEQSGLGYPISDEHDNPAVLLGRINEFEFGSIAWSDELGVAIHFPELPPHPQVKVKIVDGIPIHLTPGTALSLDELLALAGPHSSDFITLFIQGIFPNLAFRRTFDSLTPAEIQALITRARESEPAYQPPNFENFLEIDCPDANVMHQVATGLNQWTGVVEYAYTAPLPEDASIIGTSNPFFTDQGYLAAFPLGIDAAAAWAEGATGAGIHFIDIENGWFVDHEDLPPGIRLLAGTIRRRSLAHGTAVLGIVVGMDNNAGIVGIAPEAKVSLLSDYLATDEAVGVTESMRQRLADRILKAASLLSFGDVLLIEVQLQDPFNNGQRLPVEVDPMIFQAIRLATLCGVIVVEPAGNDAVNLDQYVDLLGFRVLARDIPTEFRDSGAIMVGACASAPPHHRWATFVADSSGHQTLVGANFGSRIDCHAWGENIRTTGNRNNPVQKDGYMNDMGGTSGASAIIAGVCLLVQHLQSLLDPKSGIVGRLGPGSMRRMLSNPQNGTAPSPGEGIGSMPNLAQIIFMEYH